MNNITSFLKDKVEYTLTKHNMLDGVSKIVVGFSGGADSVCLLHILNSLKSEHNINLTAVHINHGIRGDEADRDMDFCFDFCKNFCIEFKCVKINCPKEAEKSKESIELCARRMRYDALNSFCDENCVIATAHNANDNAETVLFNLSRGTALKGVSGIPYKRDNIIRPLLDCTREEIEKYCRQNDLSFVTDSTNLEDEYTRNKIRHNVVPQLSLVNSNAVGNINNFSRTANEISDFITIEAEKTLDNAFIKENTYNALCLKSAHIALLRECVVIAFSRFSDISVDRDKIDSIINVINNGGRIQLYGEIYAECVKNNFRFYKNECKCFDNELSVDNMNKTYLFNGFDVTLEKFTDNLSFINKKALNTLFDYDKIKGDLFLRTRKEGDTFSQTNRTGTKTLKKLFNENNIPVEKRNILPILCDSEGIVWIYSVGVSKRCAVDENTTNIIFVKGENNG